MTKNDDPPARTDRDGDKMGEQEDRFERWREYVRNHPDRVTEEERRAVND